MTKIAHLADSHIRNLKYHREYKSVFNKIYEALKKEKVDFIVHCGDLAHTKTQLSPEYFDLACDFIKNLADIAPLYLIPGNHDGNLKNSSRQDAISPIVKALDHKNVNYLKNSGEIKAGKDIVFNVLSVFDEDNWAYPSDPTKINIALYHGAISGVQTDIGYTMEHGDHDLSVFKGHDYALLGDIHKTNQILDTEGRVRYAGSTVQQNHGETNDKGFLVWYIEDKDNFKVKHFPVENPSPFVTIELTEKGRIPKNTEVPEGARIRLAIKNKVTISQLKRSIDVAKKKFKAESVTYYSKGGSGRTSVQDLVSEFENEDLRDLAVQNKLIREFLKDYELDEDSLKRVEELNKKYNTIAEQEEEISRNINWIVNKLDWSNLFNYGEDNSINFESLKGVVGIFGKNFSGKSSIIDSFLWVLENSTSKNVRKNLNIINQNKESGSGRVEIQVENKVYVIDRRADKYIRKLKGEETEEAKTEVDFSYYDKAVDDSLKDDDIGNLNGTSRQETDKEIRKMFGTLEDFLFTSMSSQNDALSFINEGATKRKEILAKFLDLDIFAKKYKLANEEVSDLKGALKRLEGHDFDTEILEAEQAVKENEVITDSQKKRCDLMKDKIKVIEAELSAINSKLDSSPEIDLIDIEELKKEIETLRKSKSDLLEENRNLFEKIGVNRESLEKVEAFVSSFDPKDLRASKDFILERENEINRLLVELVTLQDKKNVSKKKLNILQEVPCGDQFPTCKFLIDAHDAKKRIEEIDAEIASTNSKKVESEELLEGNNLDEINSKLEKYELLLEKRRTSEKLLSSMELKHEQNNSKLIRVGNLIVENEEKVEEYNNNVELIKTLKEFRKEKKQKEEELKTINQELEECEEEVLALYKDHGSLEQKLENLEDMMAELVDLREQYSAHDMFLNCMHSNGISYDLIRKRLPIINEEIVKVLTNVVNFEVYFEDDGKKLDVNIRHPKYEARPIELGSGAEKSLAAMAIRLALIKVSSLPISNIFVLDEPATALDEENMEGFIRIIEMVKAQFDTVVLISHLDVLKDIVDQQIVIDKSGGYASVQI